MTPDPSTTRLGRQVHILTRFVWPAVLATRIIIYGLAAEPTHLAFWHIDRGAFITTYALLAGLIVASIGRTRRTILVAKLGAVTFAAFASAIGDLATSQTTAQRWLDPSGWVIIAVANVIAILLRLSWMTDSDGRA